MAVSETASSCTCSSASGEAPASAARPKRWRRPGMAVLLAFAALSLPAQSQITADPNAVGSLRPTVLTAPNGVPLVNIQSPSAAGVSRNVYRQFDVSAQGAILNNSRTDVQTQLGGWVGANPWLAAGPARVILNEVNSSQPSQLSGWVEVGGQRAEVVIANPAGINVNGASFINASRATLTTGVPVMNAGALEGFRVQGGQVRVEGLGLDVTQTDHTAILARAVELNAGIWANALTVVTGVNEISANTASVTPVPETSTTGAAPAFALDVAAIGGMYAGKIHLIGTEAGVGVRNAGNLSARSGDLVLDANGWLHNSGSLVASNTVDLKTSGLTQHGLIDAQTTRITTGDLLNEGSGRIDGDTIDITARSLTNDSGAVIAARHTLTATTGTLINREGALLLSAGDMALTATEPLENSGSLVAAQTLDIQSRDITQHGLIDAQTTRISTRTLVNEGSGRIYGDTIDIQADAITNDNGAVIAARSTLSATTGTLVNREGALLLSVGDMTLVATERLENRSANIETLGKLSITTPVLVNANDHVSHTVVTDAATNHTVYHLASGTLDATDVAWSVVKPLGDFTQYAYDAHRREWLLPKTSAYADAAFKTYYLGALPFVPAHVIWWDFGDSGHSEAVGDTFTYSRHSPIWAHFGMAAPTWDAPGQMPAGTYDSEGNLMSPPDPQAVAIWQAQAAPWAELTTRVASFKTAIESQFLPFDAYSNYTQTSQRAVMTRSEPARIVSGGAMSLNATQSLLNQDSEIVAGGALAISGVTAANQATEVSAPTSRSGTFSSWGVTGRDCDPFGCDPEYGWIHTPYAETIAQTVPLPALRYASHSAAVPTSGIRPPLSPNLNNALFTLSLDPASRAVFISDPRFAGERPWLSSDYLLGTLALDPATTQRRVGDGFIEQRLIREQVGALTGQRFLGDFTDDEQQYLALMNAGATFAQAHQLRPGITLSAEQVAALTSDIVWLETQTVTLPDGTTAQALVPRVYLLPRAGDLAPDGALIAGRDVQINLDGDVLNTGTLAGRRIVQINAQNLHNTGFITGQTTALNARDDVNNVGGTISATDALIVQAGRDLNVQTTTASGQGAAGVGRYSSEQVNRLAGLYVSDEAGVLLASAGRDVNLTAAALQAGSVQMQARRDLNLTTVNTGSLTDIRWNADNRLRVNQREEIGTHITANGDVVLRAGQDITARAAQVQVNGDLSAVAGRNVIIEAGETTFELDEARRTKSSGPVSSKTTTTQITHRSAKAQVSHLQGQNVEVLGTNVVSVGTHIQGQSSVHIEGTEQTLLYAAQDRSFTQVDVTTKRSSVVGPKYRKTESTDIEFSNVGIGTELIANEAIRIGVGERTELIGARVSAPSIEFTSSEHAAPDAAGELLLGAVVDQDNQSHQSKTVTDGLWQKIVNSGHETEALKPTELHGQVQFDPSLRITAQIPAGPLRQQIEQLAQQPGLAHLAELAQREDIDWQAIDLAQRQWHDKQQGLTGAGAAILTLVVAFFTAGMGTAAAGTATAAGTTAGGVTLATTTAAGVTTYTAAGAALNAAFTSLASTAAVSFVNNGGDLGAVFKDLGSSASVNQLITGMLTAGAVNSLSSQLSVGGKQLADITIKDGFTSYFGKSLIEQSTSAAMNSALNGTSLKDGLQSALITSALGSATALGANAIGDLGLLEDLNGQPVLNPAGKAVLHALLGCAGGAVQSGSQGCAAGASGAVLGELAAQWYDPSGNKPRADTEAFAAAVAGLGGVLAGDESGAGVNIAAAAGRNAAANNFLNHVRPNMLRLSEMEQYERAAQECASGDANACARGTALVNISRERDRELQQACSGATPTLCNSLSAEARALGNTVHGQSGQLVYANSPKAGFDLNVATVGQVTLNPALRQNFHIQLAQSTSQGLLFALPGPEDVVVGALLLTAPGKVLAEVVVQGGQKLLRFADGVVAPVGSAEAKLLAEARVRNNARTDDGQQYDQFRNSTADGWDWKTQAPNDGAVLGTRHPSVAKPGDTLDRYGSRKGEFLSPSDTAFEQRSLPPGKQSDPYEKYTVTKEFQVVQEEIAPAFGHPGGGTQLRARIPEVENGFANIDDLIRFGYLKDPKGTP